MTEHFIAGNPPIPLLLRHSARARRISLRVSGLDGRVTLTVPKRVPEAEALEFARSRRNWLERQLARQPDPVPVGLGCELPMEGRLLSVAAGSGRRVQVSGDRLLVPGEAAQAGLRVRAYFKETARHRLTEACDRYADRLGRRHSRMTLRDTRSRWGSCSSRGALMFSWRLIMAPSEVLAYVAAHEVAHLAEMNHGPRFWQTVEGLYGAYEAPRRWLREHGQKLHHYRFPD